VAKWIGWNRTSTAKSAMSRNTPETVKPVSDALRSGCGAVIVVGAPQCIVRCVGCAT
jgi:hypothetical protein